MRAIKQLREKVFAKEEVYSKVQHTIGSLITFGNIRPLVEYDLMEMKRLYGMSQDERIYEQTVKELKKKEYITPLIELATKKREFSQDEIDSRTARLVSINILSNTNYKGIYPVIASLLKDEDPKIIRNAMHNLLDKKDWKINDETIKVVFEAIVDIVETGKEKDHRYNKIISDAARYFHEIPEKSIPIILEYLRNDDNPTVRDVVGFALSKIGRPAQKRLIEVIKEYKNESSDTRIKAAAILRVFDNYKEIIEELKERLRFEMNQTVANEIADSLDYMIEKSNMC
jgi:hypothetical protein